MIWHKANTSGGQGLVICEATGRNVAVTYDAADAPLVAAAPVMLAALKAAHQYMIDYNKCDNHGLLRDMADAIWQADECNHDWQRDGTSSGGCIGLVCTRCGEYDEKDVS
jgi:hypothetical protein